MGRRAADLVAALDECDRLVAARRHARDRADLVAVDDQRIANADTGDDVDDAQRLRRISTPTVHPLDEFLPRVAPFREAHRDRHHSGDRRNRLTRQDLESHPGPPGSNAGGFMVVRRPCGAGGFGDDLGRDADLEAAQSGRKRLAVPGVDIEHEPVISGPGDAGERFDLARRLEHQRPCRVADNEVSQVLGNLGVQVGESVRALDDHVVAGGFVDGNGIRSHGPSLPWHTANVMTYDDNTSDGRLHDLATRTVDSLLTLVHRGTRLAVGLMVIVVVVCLSGFALGIAALSDGMETVWIIFGGFAAFIAIGAVGMAMFRLWVITRLGTALVSDVERLITGDPRSERVVIEAVEASDGVQDQSAVVMSRQFFTMNDTVVTAGQFTALAIALKSVTAFPLLMLLATAITIGFAGLGFLFFLGIIL